MVWQSEIIKLSDLTIDIDKDWEGHIIKNLGEPVDPYDVARKTYVDVVATGLGITLFLLDATDSEVPSYKSMSVGVPVLSEAYVEVSSNSAGDVEIAGWIAPSDFAVVKLGTIAMHLQAEKTAGNIDVRLFFRLYERASDGTETLINESSLSDLVTERANFVVSMVLPSDYILATGSRLVVKLYARYLSSGSSTTVRVYYQGDVRSRVTFPITKEVMDTLYLPYTGAKYDVDLGTKYLNVGSLRVGGTEVVDSARNLKNVTTTRSIISDFFGSPFWDNIPDKPSKFPPELHASSHGLGGSDELSLDASQITSGTLSADRIPGLDASKIVSGRLSVSRLPTSSTANRFLVVRTANADPVFDSLKSDDIPSLDASKITSGVFDVARIPDLSRSKITDFFSSPFWDNIPDKPSVYPPASHASSHQSGGADELPLNTLPVTGNVNLGSYSLTAAQVTVGDLVLENKDKSAKWRIIEEPDGIYVKNDLTGKLYRIKLEEVS